MNKTSFQKATVIIAVLIVGVLAYWLYREARDDYLHLSATATIMTVKEHENFWGSDIKTTMVFSDGQVLSVWDTFGEKGDVLFFDSVAVRPRDSSVVHIFEPVKNLTKARQQYPDY